MRCSCGQVALRQIVEPNSQSGSQTCFARVQVSQRLFMCLDDCLRCLHEASSCVHKLVSRFVRSFASVVMGVHNSGS
jgi:hypothetical protein